MNKPKTYAILLTEEELKVLSKHLYNSERDATLDRIAEFVELTLTHIPEDGQ